MEVQYLAEQGGVPHSDMERTWNCGLGMVAIVAPERRYEALALLQETGAREIGVVAAMPEDERVVIANVESAWKS